MAGIRLKEIGKRYEDSKEYVVKNLDLEIRDKEFLVLVGPSGCGKTTVLRMIAGLEDISEGELFIDEQKVNDVEPKDRDVAMVFQNYALYPHLSVFGNIAYPLKQRRVTRLVGGKEKRVKYSKEEIRTLVERTAELLNVKHLLKRRPKALSGGERQRVALARAMVRNPKVFLMDEPLSNLDAQLRTQTRSEILRLHRHVQTTFVYVTHDQTEALTMGDRIVVMDHGEIQQIASPYAVFHHPANLFVAKFIGTPAMNLLECDYEKKEHGLLLFIKEMDKHIEVMCETSLLDKTGQVVLGIRPEDIVISDSDGTEMNVLYSELLGTDTILHLDGKEAEILCKVPTETYSGEEKIKARLNQKKIHVFDKRSGAAIPLSFK